ncbi:MAG: hypothetical protein AAF901_02620, partial [Bacteroidota bacterium]
MRFSLQLYITWLTIAIGSLLFSQEGAYAKRSLYLFEKIAEYTYTNQDSAYHYGRELKELAKTNDNWFDFIEVHFEMNNVALFTFNFDLVEENLKILDS